MGGERHPQHPRQRSQIGSTVTGKPRDVRALLTFLGEVSGTPTNYFEVEPPPGTPRLYPRVRREVVVHDATPIAGELSVDRQGVVLTDHRDGVIGDFHDDQALRAIYYPAVERLVCAVTGATRALVFDHTHRSSAVARRAADGTDIAVDEAHNDYTERSGPRRVRELLAGLLPGEDPDPLLRGRHAIFNVWRPINGPVEQWPLAVCDMQSMTPVTSSMPSSGGRTGPAMSAPSGTTRPTTGSTSRPWTSASRWSSSATTPPRTAARSGSARTRRSPTRRRRAARGRARASRCAPSPCFIRQQPLGHGAELGAGPYPGEPRASGSRLEGPAIAQWPCAALRAASNSSPGTQLGSSSALASLTPTANPSCAFSIIPSKFQSGWIWSLGW